MYSKTQLFIFGAVLVLVVAIVLPSFFRSSKSVSTVDSSNQFRNAPGNPRQEGSPAPTPKGKGWAISLAPYYSLGVFAYVLYIMYKISKKKPGNSSATKRISSPIAKPPIDRIGGNQKTKITSFELQQLEEKLSESERTVQKILEQANKVITEVYKKEMEKDESDDSTLSDSTDSSIQEKDDDIESTSLSDSDSLDDVYDRPKIVELGSSSDEFSYEEKENCEDVSDGEFHVSHVEENLLQSEPSLEASCKTGLVNSLAAKVDTAESAESEALVEDRKKLLSTTKEVMSAMHEIRSYIEEHKS